MAMVLALSFAYVSLVYEVIESFLFSVSGSFGVTGMLAFFFAAVLESL